jgi:hypothetical protein
MLIAVGIARMQAHNSIKLTPAKSIVISVGLSACCLTAVAPAEQVRTVVPRATLNYLSIPVAEVKGFFRDQGLENQTIVIPGSTAIAALVSGNCGLQRRRRQRHARSAPGRTHQMRSCFRLRK